MKATKAVFVLVLFAACASASHAESDVERAVTALKNFDVTWDGNFFGLEPLLSPRAERVVALGEAARPALMIALMREDSFEVAHVILTKISRSRYAVDAAQWNELRVTLIGRAAIVHPQQRFALLKKWNAEANKAVDPTPLDAPRNPGGSSEG